ncbi:MAG: hypothetical protein R3E04_10825 [Sphingobium sp.]
MIRQALIASVAVQVVLPGIAGADEIKATGAQILRITPHTIPLSFEDRMTLRRAKHTHFGTDEGSAGLDVTFMSVSSNQKGNDPFADNRRLHARWVSLDVWHDFIPTVAFGFAASAQRTSRRDVQSPIFSRKSHATSLALEANLRFTRDSVLQGGWYNNRGWGGRAANDDAIRIANGDPASENGMRVSLRMPWINGLAPNGRASWDLSAADRMRIVGLNQPAKHDTVATLRISAPF